MLAFSSSVDAALFCLEVSGKSRWRLGMSNPCMLCVCAPGSCIPLSSCLPVAYKLDGNASAGLVVLKATKELALRSARTLAETPVGCQAQEALLKVVSGLDELALPGCATALGDLVSPCLLPSLSMRCDGVLVVQPGSDHQACKLSRVPSMCEHRCCAMCPAAWCAWQSPAWR